MSSYPLETHANEFARLRIQSQAMAPDAQILLDRIGVEKTWRCLDLGCGPYGLANLLSPRTAHVTGLDQNEAFLAEARSHAFANAEFLHGDVYQTGLPSHSFHLTHCRFLASTAGDPERLLAEAIRVTRPGGIVALQEPDGQTLNCYPPHPAWDRLKLALLGAFTGSGADLTLAHRLYSLVHATGLQDVQYRTFLLAVRAGDPMIDYLPATVESLRATVLRLGLITEGEFDATLAACRRHLDAPGTSFTMYTVAQVWGRKPAH